MSSARRSSLNENLSTFGDDTRDYTALETWANLTEVDLVTAQVSERLVCFNDPTADFEQQVFLENATTSIDYNRIISVNPGDEHNGIPGQGVTFSGAIGGAGHLVALEPFVRFYDLASTFTSNATADRRSFTCRVGSSDCLIVGCLSYDVTNSHVDGTAHGFNSDTSGNIFIDCISINPEGSGFVTPDVAYNCTSVGGVSGFIGDGSTVKNCLANGASTSDFSGTFHEDSFRNASSDGTAPGGEPEPDKIFTFVDAVNDDYHLDITDTGARNFGVDLSADATFDFDDDIDRDLFNTWDIGFDEPEISMEDSRLGITQLQANALSGRPVAGFIDKDPSTTASNMPVFMHSYRRLRI